MGLNVNNVVRVTVLSQLRGLADINTSALALITDEAPIPGDFGTYRAYKDPSGVASDFGSNSDTYRLAVMVFSQNPSILTGAGSLIVIPRDQSAAATAATLISSSLIDFTQLTATDYEISVAVDGGYDTDCTIGEIDTTSLATIASSLNSTDVSNLGMTFSVSGEVTAARVTLVSDTTGAASSLSMGAAATGTDIASLLGLSGTAVGTAAGLESAKDAILRTYGSVSYFGIIYNDILSDAALTECAKLVQAIDKIQFVGSNDSADITGIFTTLLNSSLTNTRMLYYSNSASEAVDFAAGYASRGLSVNFSGTNTMLTMNLKEIAGLVVDPIFSTTLGQTRYDACKAAGVDVYADYGVPGVASFGVNKFFDEVYIQLALKLKLQVAGFNFLKQNPFKTPQTEEGVAGLKGAYRKVLQQFVTNGSFAPGTWTSPVYFGTPDDQIRSIAEFGYWLYSIPVSQQSSTDREARIAPVIQIAAKSSGAIHSSDVIVYVER